jgi:hypothetical protein
MDDKNQQIQAILHHIKRIEGELGLLRQLITQLAENNDETDQDLIIVDTELVIHKAVVQPAPVVPKPRPRPTPRPPTRREIHQDARWRAPN